MLLAACIISAPAWPQSWNMYNGPNTSVELPFVDGPMSYTKDDGQIGSRPARINILLPGGTSSTPIATIMDTGSTGIVVGSAHFQPSPGQQSFGTGTTTYTSSSITYTGTYYDTQIQIYDKAGTTVVATSTARVLYVSDPAVADFTYMGVGFNRKDGSGNPEPVIANPFLNLTSVNPAAGPIGELRKGYIVKNDRVILGIPQTANMNFSLVKLVQNPVDWNATSMSVSVNGVTGPGTTLQDTGIGYMFISPPAGSCLSPPQPGSCVISGSSPPKAKDGTEIKVWLPGQTGSTANYTFKISSDPDDPNALKPDKVEVVTDPTDFVNTGRQFFSGFDYLYDYENGYVGYYWTGAVDSAYGGSTAGLALTGPVNLPNGFTSSFATFLMGPTTLMQTGSGTLSGIISGSGGLTIGSGQVSLTGVNTYFGGTTVTGGATLGINADSGLGDQSGRLTLNNGTLLAGADITSSRAVALGPGGGTFNTNGNNITLATGVTGVGGLTKAGDGILTLEGENRYTGGTTVAAGTLDLTGSMIGSLSILAGATFTTTGGWSLATGAFFSNAGTFRSLGGGPLVNRGTLVNNGAMTTDLVNSGILSGIGTITGTVTNNGIVAPGNSIGTLTVNGSYTQASGSTYQVETNSAGQADRINVIGAPGTATINGGFVTLTAATGIYAPSTTYTILNATGGVIGTYADANSLFPFLQPSLSYDTNNVYLTLKPGGFARGAQTTNQSAVGRVLDQSVASSSGDFATVIGTLATFNLSQGQAAMAAISGQNYSGFSTANVGNSLLFMNALGQQMAAVRTGRGDGTRIALAEACDAVDAEACDGERKSPWSLWATAMGGTGSIAGNANAGTLTYSAGGVATGFDYRLDPNLLLGAGVGFASGSQWVGGFSGQGSTNSYQASLFASFTQAAFYFDALAGYGYNDNQMTRQIVVPGLVARNAQGRTGANQLLGQAEAGYKIGFYEQASASLTPFARFQATGVSQAGFTESGAQSLNLSVAQQTTTSVRTVLGAELAGGIEMGWIERLGLQFRLGWAHEYADTARPTTAAFAGAPGQNFTVYGAAPLRDAVTLGLGASTAVAAGTSIFLRYDGEFSTGSSINSLTGGFRMTW